VSIIKALRILKSNHTITLSILNPQKIVFLIIFNVMINKLAIEL